MNKWRNLIIFFILSYDFSNRRHSFAAAGVDIIYIFFHNPAQQRGKELPNNKMRWSSSFEYFADFHPPTTRIFLFIKSLRLSPTSFCHVVSFISVFFIIIPSRPTYMHDIVPRFTHKMPPQESWERWDEKTTWSAHEKWARGHLRCWSPPNSTRPK